MVLESNLFLAFIAVSSGIILFPGPNVLLIVSHTINQGTKRGLVTVAGTSSAMAIQLAIATLGMTSAMIVLSAWFEWLRWCGVAYLIYIGVQQWRFASVDESSALAAPPPTKAVYWRGFFVSLTNPKTILFFAAFLPQFVNPARPALAQMALLSATFLCLATLLDSLYAVFAGQILEKLADPRRIRLRNRLSGSLFIGAGLALALIRRVSSED